MPNFTMVIPHRLAQEEALHRIKGMVTRIKAENPDKINDLYEQWTGYSGEFSFTAQSFLFSGKITVEPTQVRLEADLPLMAMLFKAKIEAMIRQEAETLLIAE
ncbi:MAG: polyhydroxyalkanoic acid system family protein [bacterium]